MGDEIHENIRRNAAKVKEHVIETSKLIDDYKKKQARIAEL